MTNTNDDFNGFLTVLNTYPGSKLILLIHTPFKEQGIGEEAQSVMMLSRCF